MESILVADDNDGIIQALQRFLPMCGYKVEVASNGRDAVRLFGTPLKMFSCAAHSHDRISALETYLRICNFFPFVAICARLVTKMEIKK